MVNTEFGSGRLSFDYDSDYDHYDALIRSQKI